MSDARASRPEEMSRSYGFREVDAAEKQPMVDAVFHKVARRYDLMNDVMSGGMHRLWKDAMVTRLNPPRRPGWTCLDVAGGTGDIAMRIVDRSHGHAKVTVLDINGSMLEVGRERAAKRGLIGNLDFVEANAEMLPFGDNSFDAYTIAFGIRNVPRIDVALAEAFRVLKHGGRFLCLEFSRVDLPLLDRLYDEWSLRAIPRMGEILAGEGEPYRYLVNRSASSRTRSGSPPLFVARVSNRWATATLPAASPRCIGASSFDAGRAARNFGTSPMSLPGSLFSLGRAGWVLAREGVISSLPSDGMPRSALALQRFAGWFERRGARRKGRSERSAMHSTGSGQAG